MECLDAPPKADAQMKTDHDGAVTYNYQDKLT